MSVTYVLGNAVKKEVSKLNILSPSIALASSDKV